MCLLYRITFIIFILLWPYIVCMDWWRDLYLIWSKLACEQAHLIGKGGGAAIASRWSRREEWGEEKWLRLRLHRPCLSSEPARRLGQSFIAQLVWNSDTCKFVRWTFERLSEGSNVSKRCGILCPEIHLQYLDECLILISDMKCPITSKRFLPLSGNQVIVRVSIINFFLVRENAAVYLYLR